MIYSHAYLDYHWNTTNISLPYELMHGSGCSPWSQTSCDVCHEYLQPWAFKHNILLITRLYTAHNVHTLCSLGTPRVRPRSQGRLWQPILNLSKVRTHPVDSGSLNHG